MKHVLQLYNSEEIGKKDIGAYAYKLPSKSESGEPAPIPTLEEVRAMLTRNRKPGQVTEGRGRKRSRSRSEKSKTRKSEHKDGRNVEHRKKPDDSDAKSSSRKGLKGIATTPAKLAGMKQTGPWPSLSQC